MRARLAPLALLLAAACAPAIPDLDSKDGTGDGIDAGSGDGSEDGSDGADPDEVDPGDDPGDEPDPEPDVNEWAGDWYAWVTISAELGGGGWGDQGVECAGEMEVTIDEDGAASGSGSCEIWRGVNAELVLDGDVDDRGDFDGLVLYSAEYVGDSEVPVSGEADGDDRIIAAGEGVVTVGGWGGDYDVPLFADVQLER